MKIKAVKHINAFESLLANGNTKASLDAIHPVVILFVEITERNYQLF